MALTENGHKLWTGEAPELTLFPQKRQSVLGLAMSEYANQLVARLSLKKRPNAYEVHEALLLLQRRYFILLSTAQKETDKKALHASYQTGFEQLQELLMQIDPPLITRPQKQESISPMVLGLPVDPSIVGNDS